MHIGPSELIIGLLMVALLVWVAKIADTSGGSKAQPKPWLLFD